MITRGHIILGCGEDSSSSQGSEGISTFQDLIHYCCIRRFTDNL